MTNNKESFQESLMIKRAKIRLFGAIIILILLFTLSIFFLKDRTNINLKAPINISFLEKNNEITIEDNIFKSSNLPTTQRREMAHVGKIKEARNFNGDEGPYFIQLGIFSDETNASKLLAIIKSKGYDARLETMRLSGKDKLRRSTTTFNSKTEAQAALIVLKSANLSGIIKRE